MNQDMEKKSIDAIRILSADAIQKAKSGHPGMPLGAAAMGYELWAHHLNHNPADPQWENRDRFILSAGHGSMLLYALMHFFGYGLTLDDIKDFRQFGTAAPGHPEYGRTPGVEATTGPLGAGLGMAVGMAIAEAHLASVFNKPGYPVVSHYTYALAGDGCMMEGISSEALSLAGTLGLSRLIILYDSNKISIEGDTDLTFTEDVMKRVEAFGFQTLFVADGNDTAAIGRAIEEAKADTEHPSFIVVRTQIGYGCPAKQGKETSHGEPLGEENVKALRETLGWESGEAFYVPEDVYAHYRALAEPLKEKQAQWEALFASYKKEYPEMASLWDEYKNPNVAAKLDADPLFWKCTDKPQATRNRSGEIIDRLKDLIPSLIGGAADLAPSTKTYMKGQGDFQKGNYGGRNIRFGVREMAMAAIGNGLALHGGCAPFVSTFFVFSDYAKPMARLSAMMKVPLVYIFTHDSIGVGEDGPTHQPIEQLATLRAIPNFNIFRPADAMETTAAWYFAATAKTAPTALVLTRQNLPQLKNTSREAIKGGYILEDSRKATPDVILIATGSEVAVAVDAKALLLADGIDARVVSMPSMDVFELQDSAYKEQVLPKKVRARVVVEALSGFGWERYAGLDGACVTMKDFGTSAPGSRLFKEYGFTPENVAEVAKGVLAALLD